MVRKMKAEKKECWADKRVKKLDAVHLQFVKLSVFAFALLVAKLWPQILGLKWYWYLVICLVAAYFPFRKIWLALCK